MLRHAFSILVLLLSSPSTAVFAADNDRSEPALTVEALEFFERQVRPLLVDRCYECHSAEAESAEGEFRLDSRSGILTGGETGPAVVPGKPAESLLIKAIGYADPLLQMPPDEKLSAREIAILERWVSMGLPDPRQEGAPTDKQSAETDQIVSSDWWSFQPVRYPAVPTVKGVSWTKTETDRFVLSKLEANGMSPAPVADKRVLIRRATFDLTGLPPTPTEVQSYLDDQSSDAFAKVIDRLLNSRHYGERWGRHWLDVVRYADTSGCNGDFPMPEAYRYRNYVIRSFNNDKPYDQFLREQIAGDLLPAGSDEERYDQVIATGYLAISRRFSSLGEEFHLTLDDTIDNFGKAILGVSVSCARCHDHKFDPIPQSDYYGLHGIFESTRYAFPGTEIYRHMHGLTPLVPQDKMQAEVGQYLSEVDQLDAKIFEVYSHMASLDTGKAKDKAKAEWKSLQAKRDELVKKSPSFARAYGVSEGTPTNSRIQIKGDPENLGPEIPRRFLQILGGYEIPTTETGSGRLQLAEWITSPENPLTARVIVNRIWLHHFGKGLVRTPNDFGTRGAEPTHPDLLEFLTSEFVNSGWSIKALHKQIMLSSAWQMACVENRDYSQRDPDNRHLWRFERRRLDAEEIRDAILAVSGELDRSMGGPHPFKPEVEWRYTQHRPFVDDFPTKRRSVYLMQQRIRQQPYLGIFDGADTNVVTGARKTSTTPQQALFMLNDELMHNQSVAFANRILRDAHQPPQQIARAYELAFGRPASTEEISDALDYLDSVAPQLREAGIKTSEIKLAAWSSYLRGMLASNEFQFVD